MQVSLHHKVLAECSKLSFIHNLQQKALDSWLSSNKTEPVRFLKETSNNEGYKTYHFFEVSPHQTLKNVLVVRG